MNSTNIVTLRPNDILLVDGIIFVLSNLPIGLHDLVLDRRDGIYGFCQSINPSGDIISIKKYDGIEHGVSIDNVHRLTNLNPENN